MLCDSIVKKMFDFKYFQYFEIVLKIRKKGGKKFKNVIPLSISFFERKFFPGFISKPLFTFNFMIRYKKFHRKKITRLIEIILNLLMSNVSIETYV